MRLSASKNFWLALVLLLLLSGCGGQNTEEAPPPEEDPPAAQSEKVPPTEGVLSALSETPSDKNVPPPQPPRPEDAALAQDVSLALSGLEKTDWQVVSTYSGDFGMTEQPIGDPAAYGGSASLPLDKLIAFSLASDGAASEDLFDELRRRFLEAPNTTLAYLVLMGDQHDGYWNLPAAEVVCRSIASTDAAMYGGSEEFAQTMAACRKTYSEDRAAELLDILEREHAASMERNQ